MRGEKIAVVVSKFNEFITQKLLDGCIQTLTKSNIDKKNIFISKVPGTFEIPTTASFLLETKKYDAIICLGAVIRGETSHYDHICESVSAEIAKLGVIYKKPVIFGIITCENLDQALARSGGEKGNKGSEAALAALEMIGAFHDLLSTTV